MTTFNTYRDGVHFKAAISDTFKYEKSFRRISYHRNGNVTVYLKRRKDSAIDATIVQEFADWWGLVVSYGKNKIVFVRPTEDKLLTFDEVKAMPEWPLSRYRVYDLTIKKVLRGIKVGKSWRVYESSVHEYLATR